MRQAAQSMVMRLTTKYAGTQASKLQVQQETGRPLLSRHSVALLSTAAPATLRTKMANHPFEDVG